MSDKIRSSVENRLESYNVLFRSEDRGACSQKLLATACELLSRRGGQTDHPESATGGRTQAANATCGLNKPGSRDP